MRNPANDLSSATAAYLKGLEDSTCGLGWLKRARRLAPEDPRIELEIARRELSTGLQRAQLAYTTFLRLAERYDIAAGWIGAAVSAQILGNTTAAARALEELLTRHCVPEDASFLAFAKHVAVAAGYDGYRGLTATGEESTIGAGHLLAAQPDLEAISRVEGIVEWKKGGLSGWAVRPAWPDHPPHLTLKDAAGRTLSIKCGLPLPIDEAAPFLPRYRFRVTSKRLDSLFPPFFLSGPSGTQIMGSPVDPRPLQCSPIAASTRGIPPHIIPAPAPLVLIMPIYRGFQETQAAVESVLDAAPPNARFVLIDDASPDPDLAQWLNALPHQEKKIQLIHHANNLGFCAAANSGFNTADGCDVLLLNSDILLPKGAVETLQIVAYSDAAIGTVTPLSNEATICSYPNARTANPMPDLAKTSLYNRLAREANDLSAVEIPTGVGFCFYIRHDCLKATGVFRREVFAQGYGEENDFCIRARHAGFKHVAAVGAFVAHKGGVSFRSATRALSSRNSGVLNHLYPGYGALITEHIIKDPISRYRTTLDEARLCHQQRGKESILMISHAHGGGVTRQVDREAARLREEGFNPLLLTTEFPRNTGKVKYPWPSLLCDGDSKNYPNLTFRLPQDSFRLLRLLRSLNIKRVELHHMLGQHQAVRDIAAALGIPQDIVTHDYASFCPKVNLLTRSAPDLPLRYCGEPDIVGCKKCCQQDKAGIFESLPVRQLVSRSRAEFAAARRVVVPSEDMARRLSRHFPGIVPQVNHWEDDSLPVALRKPRSGARRIAILGGIGPAKGFDILLDCAKDARQRSLPLEFTVIGSSSDDNLLLETGIMVTGAYKHEEVQSLIADLEPDLALVPSICPETWCFVLTEAWNAGLYTIVFDLGAQAERVRATGRGSVLPLGLSPDRVNNALMNITF